MNSKNEWNYFNAGRQTYISIPSPSKVYKGCKNSSYLVKLSELLIVSHFLFRNSSSKFHRPQCTFKMAFHKEYSRRRRGKDLSNKPLPRPLFRGRKLKVSFMSSGAAGGLWRHPKWSPSWPPSWILPRIINQVKTSRSGDFLCFILKNNT